MGSWTFRRRCMGMIDATPLRAPITARILVGIVPVISEKNLRLWPICVKEGQSPCAVKSLAVHDSHRHEVAALRLINFKATPDRERVGEL